MICHQVPEYFQNRDLRLILFGGKGGVGKTTMAATSALHLARACQKGKKVLVLSTDPAHSLADSFEIEIGDKVTPIDYDRPKSKAQGPRPPKLKPCDAGRAKSENGTEETSDTSLDPGLRTPDLGPWTSDLGSRTSDLGLRTSDLEPVNTNLFACELDANRLLKEFKRKNDAVIKKLVDRGTYFDQQDIAEFFDLSLPGMDEVMAIIEMANLLKEETYDILIVDTAPTGHTIRMLKLPAQMRKWIEVMDLMQHKHRYMATHFTGKRYIKDKCDIFLENLSSDIERVEKLLSNRQTTQFVPVMIPELMSIYETKRLISSLEKIKIPVKEIVVNHLLDAGDADGCLFCSSKKEDQRQPLIEIEDTFSQYDLIPVPLFPGEIRGLEGMMGLEDHLLGKPGPSGRGRAKTFQVDEEPQTCLVLNPDLEFILFGGKGGVGKTSLASAAALHLAQQNPDKKFLVFSTDPAHSLADSFGTEIGDRLTAIDYERPRSDVQCPMSKNGTEETSDNSSNLGLRTLDFGPRTSDFGPRTSDIRPVNTNLFALEIDADNLFKDFKEGFKKEIEKLFNEFLGNNVDIKFDREVMTELLSLAPPGLDEIMALDTIMDLREEGKFDVFILDTSPTGHLLRFLELPDMVREWLRAFFRLLLKYKGVVRLAKVAEKALALSRNVRRIQETLIDPERSAFIAVTIPEAMGLLELERLMRAVENAKIPCDNIAINMVTPEASCDFCFSKRTEQQGYIKKIHSRFSGHSITKVPLFPTQVRGLCDLNRIGQIIFENGNFVFTRQDNGKQAAEKILPQGGQ